MTDILIYVLRCNDKNIESLILNELANNKDTIFTYVYCMDTEHCIIKFHTTDDMFLTVIMLKYNVYKRNTHYVDRITFTKICSANHTTKSRT